MKRVFSYLGVLMLVCFSFYYTEQVAKFVRKSDPIYQEILKVSEDYETSYVNATIEEDNMIPGRIGKKVNIDKSYTNMKRLGKFSEALLVFDEVVPEISSLRQYDKYIVAGNGEGNRVALLFAISKDEEKENIEKLGNILKEKEVSATFFIDGLLVEENMPLIETLSKNGNQIENLGYEGAYTKDKLIWTNNMVESLTKVEPKYCYTKYKNSKILDLCGSYHMYTVRPTIITGSYPFQTVKNKLKSGSLIHFDLNQTTLKELGPIIAYIKQKGYRIETLSEIISENRIIEK